MELKIDGETLKSPLGIVVAAIVVAAALGWMHHRRASLIEQGTTEVVRYLEMELPAREMRQNPTSPDPERLEQLGHVEVLELSPSWFFRADRDKRVKVKAVIRSGTGETETFYFYFKSMLGSWVLDREGRAPLIDTY